MNHSRYFKNSKSYEFVLTLALKCRKNGKNRTKNKKTTPKMPFCPFLMAKTGGRKNDTTECDAANGWSKNRHLPFLSYNSLLATFLQYFYIKLFFMGYVVSFIYKFWQKGFFSYSYVPSKNKVAYLPPRLHFCSFPRLLTANRKT